jgi:hypothetical protein
MGCGRQFCPGCGEELIHRDNRKGYESASALGQIIHRLSPRDMGIADIDVAAEKCIEQRHLIRILEHKQPDARAMRFSQCHILNILGQVLNHVTQCDKDPLLKKWIDPRSGVYVMRGPICGSESGRRPIEFAGPQTIRKITNGEEITCEDMDAFNDWIYGSTTWRRRAG